MPILARTYRHKQRRWHTRLGAYTYTTETHDSPDILLWVRSKELHAISGQPPWSQVIERSTMWPVVLLATKPHLDPLQAQVQKEVSVFFHKVSSICTAGHIGGGVVHTQTETYTHSLTTYHSHTMYHSYTLLMWWQPLMTRQECEYYMKLTF